MPFDHLDTSLFSSFFHASELLNFTEASKKCGITQSGLSQQISRLENQLGSVLFLRSKKNVQLTASGHVLKGFVKQYLGSIEELIKDLNQEQVAISGNVSFAMPESCLLSPAFKELMFLQQDQFPLIEMEVQMLSSKKTLNAVQDGEIHFGFSLSLEDSPGIQFFEFCQEEIVLAVSVSNEESLKDLQFIQHPDFLSYLSPWLKGHQSLGASPLASRLSYCANTSNLSSLMTMLEAGIGATLIPKHCITDLLEAKKLKILEPLEDKVVSNKIYLIYKLQKTLAKRVSLVMEKFCQIVHKKAPWL